MKKAMLVWILLGCGLLLAQVREHSNYPRLLSYYLSHINAPQNASMIVNLARNDLIVLDMELGAFNADLITGIRAVNPDAVIVAYITVSAITTEVNPDPITYSLRRTLKQGIDESWYLRNSDNTHVSDWANTEMLNCTLFCPEVGGQTWTDYLGDFIGQHIFNNELWDGVFLDNCYHSLPDTVGLDVDCNLDRISDDVVWRDQQWQAGLRQFLSELRAEYPGELILGNPGFIYPESLNGAMFEEWNEDNPSFGFGMTWPQFMHTYYTLENNIQTPQFNMVQTAGLEQQYQQMRFTLSTALLGDGYYDFDIGPTNHGQSWWYDEYNVNLGEPLETYLQEGSNKINNGDFSAGNSGWELEYHYPAAAYLSINSEAGNPYAAVVITNPHPSPVHDNYFEIALKQTNNGNLDIQRGHHYIIRFRAKASIPRQILAVLLKEGDGYPWICSPFVCDLTTDWQSFETMVTIYSGNPIPPNQVRFTYHLAQAGGTVCFDDVSITQFSLGYPAMREFENGLVICNPASSSITVPLPETYYRIAGTQDPVVNSGNSCTQVTLAARDGIILLKSRPQITLLSPDSLSYGSQWVGTASSAQTVSIKNTGTSPLTITGISFGENPPNFSYSGITFPKILAVNQSTSFSVQFNPQSDGDIEDTMLILNDSINQTALPVILAGIAVYPEPLEPQNVEIVIQGANANITWEPVTQSVLFTPFDPDCYLVFYNGSTDIDGEYYFHGLSNNCSYTHYDVAQHAEHMFYRIHAYKASQRSDLQKLAELKPGTRERDFFKFINQP